MLIDRQSLNLLNTLNVTVTLRLTVIQTLTLTIIRTLTEVRNRDLNVGVQDATLNSHLWYLACSLLNIVISPGSVLRFAVVDKTQHRNFV